MTTDYSDPLKRLVTLCGTDEGFYVLALHSFLEGFSNTIKDGFSYYASFPDVIDLLIDYLEKRGRLTIESRKALVRIAKEHDLANRVRHQFRSVTKDEAVAATSNFLAFCAAFGIVGPALVDLSSSLKLFDKARSGLEMIRELERVKSRLAEKEEREAVLLEKATKYDDMEIKLQDLASKEAEYKAELDRLRQAAEVKGARSDELRKKVFNISLERDRILKELEQYRDIGEYLQFLERFTHFTRTRLDYERSILRLSSEQEEAVGMVRESGDFIVKGSAGTGKTLVLLHALERYVGSTQGTFGFSEGRKVLLLTYTNTLVKYSKYLAHVVGRNETQISVTTADAHLLAALKEIMPGGWIDFKAPGSIIRDYNASSFLSDAELAIEIEDVIWGNLVSQEEYLEKHILRRGMKQPLNQQQRELVWSIQERLRRDLEESKRLTRNLACATILEAAERDSSLIGALSSDRIFVDEAQDLSTAAIRCFKIMSRRGVVLAADDGQSIYKIGAQYQRAGLDAAGHTRILKSNFRNTRQIHELAELFLSAGTGSALNDRASSILREGPSPELVTARNEADLFIALKNYMDLATGRLGYDAENVGILVPSNHLLDQIKEHLGKCGYTADNIKGDNFDFSSPGLIRLSTLHSSKGIEFPIVLVYLPSMSSSGEFDEKTVLSMQRNLLYVALTRAMDHVVVFTLADQNSEIVRELVEAIRSYANTVKVEGNT
jgi:superfamily I DNA/RNA helicase